MSTKLDFEHLDINDPAVRKAFNITLASEKAASVALGDFERLKRLQAMAKRRGCELHELHGGYDDDYETILIYWLFVADYKDPVVFDDIDEVEFDLKSRPVVKELRATS